ncbi:hypothetical protein EVAR_36080_1 [Eumeta japonica]|uniref:Uncharacterized protein n=1 Tax=Eumeta variegata TaxID=151549 RepID=A0A4C1YKM4_EUMVA|nr:hypothetical protein EVAR_36080_1 [Eumeta japonica]
MRFRTDYQGLELELILRAVRRVRRRRRHKSRAWGGGTRAGRAGINREKYYTCRFGGLVLGTLVCPRSSILYA